MTNRRPGRPRRTTESIMQAAEKAIAAGMSWSKFARTQHPGRNLTEFELEKLRAKFIRPEMNAATAATEPEAGSKSTSSPGKDAKNSKTKVGNAALYDKVSARSSAHILAASRAGRDIGPCPEVQDRPRRDAAFKSLHAFLITYFKATFYLEFGPDHLELIGRLQAAVEQGGLLALACPRAWGKSSIVDRAALWAVLTGAAGMWRSSAPVNGMPRSH